MASRELTPKDDIRQMGLKSYDLFANISQSGT